MWLKWGDKLDNGDLSRKYMLVSQCTFNYQVEMVFRFVEYGIIVKYVCQKNFLNKMEHFNRL